MALLTTFWPKQHKNSNISIKILITYIFERNAGRIDNLGGRRVWDPALTWIQSSASGTWWQFRGPWSTDQKMLRTPVLNHVIRTLRGHLLPSLLKWKFFLRLKQNVFFINSSIGCLRVISQVLSIFLWLLFLCFFSLTFFRGHNFQHLCFISVL